MIEEQPKGHSHENSLISVTGRRSQHKHVRSLGRRTAGSPVTDSRGAGHSPAPDHADGRPLRHVVGQHHCDPVVHGHVLRELIPVGKAGGRAAPDDTKMLD